MSKVKENVDENSSVENEDEKLLAIARKRYTIADDYWQKIYELGEEDDKFVLGQQWHPNELSARKKQKRPAVVVNKSATFIHSVANEMRQNKPAIKVRPGNSKSSKDTAKVFQGMVRAIEYKSKAQVAYNSAGEGAVRRSFGWLRVSTDYVSHDSFEQEIKIDSIENQYSVKMDPLSLKLPDGSAAKWGFVEDSMSKDEFKATYPDASSLEFDWSQEGYNGWHEKDSIKICEYFYTDFKKITICQIQDVSGELVTVEKSEVPKGAKILNERESTKPVIKWRLMTGCEVLERREWPSRFIPILPVFGSRININGEWHLESLIRHSKDSQRIYNFNKSNEVESIGLAPKAPWVAAEGQIPPEYLKAWQTANTENPVVLTYKPTTVGGELAPAPSRNVQEPAIQAITQASLMASDDIKATTGIYDDSLGRNTQSKSGVALQRTQQQSSTTNFHFMDNLSITIQHVGEICVELIPIIYDTERIVSIIGDDGTHEFVQVNKEFRKGDLLIKHMLTEGEYDVYIDVGPSYQTQRQESADTILELTKSLPPEKSALIMDLLVKNLDIPDSDEIAARIKKTIPPGIIDEKDQPPIPPQAVQQIQQMSQLIEQLTATANQQSQIINTKSNELESKERIEMAKLQSNEAIELAKLNVNESMAVLTAELKHTNDRLALLDFGQPMEQENNQPGNNAAAEQGQM